MSPTPAPAVQAASALGNAVADPAVPLVHAGLPRTATTTLQTHLFARHTQVHYLGVWKRNVVRAPRRSAASEPGAAGTGRSPQSRDLFRDAQVEALMGELLFERASSPDLERSRDLWGRICAGAPLRRKVWSWEGLATDVAERREARAANLRAVLGPARILITLRHPVTLVESTYFQILRRNNYHHRDFGDAGRVWYQPIQEWFDHYWSGELEAILDYARTVEIYRRHFGADSVRVLLFEELARDPTAYVTEVCRLAGIDAQEGVLRTARHTENPTSGRLVETLRYARRLPFGFALAQVAVGLELRGWLRGSAESEPRLDETRRRQVAERTREGNRWLSRELGLELGRFGYPL